MSRVPRSFHGYFGNGEIVRVLRRHIQGAKILSRILEFFLFMGQSGLGKTELAKAVAMELGLSLTILIATPRTRVEELNEILDKCDEGSVAFIDEVQELDHELQMLLVNRIDIFKSKAHEEAESGKNKPRVLIAATDRSQQLIRPLYERFEMRFLIRPYAGPAMVEIAGRRAREIGLCITKQSRRLLAAAARGNPRVLGHLLNRVLKHAARLQIHEVRKAHVRGFLKGNGISPNGLVAIDRAYLAYLGAMGSEGAMLGVVAMALGAEPRFLTVNVEPYLVRSNLIKIRQGVRYLTDEGRAFLSGEKQ